MDSGPELDERTARRVAFAGIVVSSVLAAISIIVGLVSRSTSVVAIGMEFAGDVLASLVVLVGMIAAVKPADEDHPYGHGRVETLAAFVVGLILSAGGVGICWNSLQAVGASHPPPTIAAVAVLIVAIAVRGGMAALKFRVGRRLRSSSLIADAWNDTVDILAAAAALTAVAVSIYDSERFVMADHYGGFAVGIIVVLTGLRVLRDASLELMDTMPDQHMIAHVRAVASAVAGVVGVDKSYARKTGFKYHVDLHVEVDPTLTVAESHVIAGRVRRQVRDHVSWVADVLVHVEPAGVATSEESRETGSRLR
jgi:cation diffusion facilitator family transporter